MAAANVFSSCPAPSPSLYSTGDGGPPVTNGLGAPIRRGQGVRPNLWIGPEINPNKVVINLHDMKQILGIAER